MCIRDSFVDGPQQASWAPGITEALNLRGQKVEFLVKPTLSIYAPFYLSSRGYSVTVRSTWPGHFDFAATNPERVSYTHLRAHKTRHDLVCRLLLEKKKKK